MIEELSLSNKVLLEAYKRGYRIDAFGNIKSPTGKQRKLQEKKFGKLKYLHVCISFNGRPKNFSVARFQAYHKFGDKIFEKGLEVRHVDGNPLNNSVDNIELGTHTENMHDIDSSLVMNAALIATAYIRKFNNDELSNLFKDRYKEKCHTKFLEINMEWAKVL